MQKIDLHVHTEKSFDGFIKVTQIEKLMKKNDLWTIAITDHDLLTKIEGTIPGMEIHSNIGDVIVLFINEEITQTEVNEILDRANEMDAFIILPHPWRSREFLDLNEKEQKFLAAKFSAIETLNGRSKKEHNQMALEFAERNGFKMVAGSDAHLPTEIGACGIELEESVEEIEDVRKALLKRKYSIFGTEISRSNRVISLAKGRYKREGFQGLVRSGLKKMNKKMRR